MSLIIAGYWQTTYWAMSYWQQDYWLEYGTAVTLRVTMQGVVTEKDAQLGYVSEKVWTDDFDPADFEEVDFDMGGGGWNGEIDEKGPWKGELEEVDE